MLTSTITFYKNTPLDSSKNFVIEGFEDFLQNYMSAIVTNFQFLELKKDIKIKLNWSQYNLDYYSLYNYNYCYIEIVDLEDSSDSDDSDDDSWQKGVYYFITDKRWLGVDTVEMTLQMDVLNTFKWDIDYKIDDKTMILRQHKDRYFTTNALHYTLKETVQSGQSYTWYITDYFIQSTTSGVGVNPTYTFVSGSGVINVSSVTMSTNIDGVRSIKVSAISVTNGTFELDIKYVPELAVIKKIDLKSEGINAPLYKISDSNINEPSNVSWSLLYRNRNNPDPNDLENPVDCFLYPNEPLNVLVPSGSNEIDAGDLPLNKYVIIFGSYNSPIPTFYWNNGGSSFTPVNEQTSYYNRQYAFALYNDGAHIQIYRSNFQDTYATGNIPASKTGSWYNIAQDDLITLDTALTKLYYYEANSLPSVTSVYSNNYYMPAWATSYITLSATSQSTINSVDTIDRTDAKNIKLITLPYCPSNYSITGGLLSFDEGWNYSGGALFLENLNTKFKNEVVTDLPSLNHYMLENINDPDVMSGWTYRELEDPKLLHSDYFRPKFVYDSFAKEFDLERFNWSDSRVNSVGYFTYGDSWDQQVRFTKAGNFKFDFITSRNIVSKFLFMFKDYTTGSLGAEDYDNILPVARNNEQVLYNSQYLNYLRAGYNYDLKAKERTEVAGGLGIGLSIAGLIGSIAVASSGAGAGIGAAGIVGSMVGLAGSLVNYTKTLAQNEDNMQRKLIELQNQGTSVLNADDFDLLEAYSNNVAKYCEYSVSENMKNALDDLFYYCGYIVNEQGVPSINTRLWFNFVQADLVVKSWVSNITNEIKDAILEKYSEGVTVFHEVVDDDVNYWDIDQTRENVEVWMPDLV